MSIVFLIYLLFILIWFGGVSVAVFHVLKYRIPGDATTKALWIFVIIAAVVFLGMVYFVSGLNWETLS